VPRTKRVETKTPKAVDAGTNYGAGGPRRQSLDGLGRLNETGTLSSDLLQKRLNEERV